MKVSEAIDQLNVGDTVWVKGEVEYITKLGALPLALEFTETTKYFAEADEISLTEPVSKEVEIPECVGKWIVYCKTRNYSLHTAINECCEVSNVLAYLYQDFRDWLTDENYQEHEEIFARAWLDGFTVEPKRWVVKLSNNYYFSSWVSLYSLEADGTAYKFYDDVFVFDDHAKAEAVATLVEGSVEEVAD